MKKLTTALRSFNFRYDSTREDEALNSRGQFLRAFPQDSLKDMSLDKYVVGKGNPTFCAFVEAKTRSWAVIQGSPSFKFGIYFGKTKADPEKKYRYTKKFQASTPHNAFLRVRSALIELLDDAKQKRFVEIDANPLSQLFKAKIISLYYPNLYINICSAEHIEHIATQLGLNDDLSISQYQHLLLKEKKRHEVSKNWSNPKFMMFLYRTFIYSATDNATRSRLERRRRRGRSVDYIELNARRDALGKKSEAFALRWEKDRLIGHGFRDLLVKIEDYTIKPSMGFDFLSFNTKNSKRYIEVKTAGRDKGANGYRFYLSENQYAVSISRAHKNSYYFYLVFYDKGGPSHVVPILASDLYAKSERMPCEYKVSFDTSE